MIDETELKEFLERRLEWSDDNMGEMFKINGYHGFRVAIHQITHKLEELSNEKDI